MECRSCVGTGPSPSCHCAGRQVLQPGFARTTQQPYPLPRFAERFIQAAQALGVLRLMISSYLVGTCTGSSTGFTFENAVKVVRCTAKILELSQMR